MSAFQSRRGAVSKPYSRPDVNGQWLHDKAPGLKQSVNNGTQKATAPNSKIVVSNLHYEITPKDLTAIFGQIGTLIREPLIRYDRSGRSSGVAYVTYETVGEATKAKNQFDGLLAKGQAMAISYDTMVPRRSASAPTGTASLLNRIQKPHLLDRLSRDDIQVKAPNGPRSTGPIRSRPGRNQAPAKRQPKKPKTAADLDKELEAFMVDEPAVPALAAVAADVEMA